MATNKITTSYAFQKFIVEAIFLNKKKRIRKLRKLSDGNIISEN